MSLSTAKKIGLAVAAFAAVASPTFNAGQIEFGTPAYAQMPIAAKVCKPEAIIKERMKQEGQMRLIVGKRTTDEWNENVFTSNADGSKGYNLEFGNGQICIAAQYRNLHIVDLSTPQNRTAIPSWALLNYDRRNAIESCKTVQGTCKPHNDSIQVAFNNGQYVSFMAITQKENPDGSLSDTGIITMTTEVSSEKGSFVTYTDPQGAREPLFAMIDTTPTQLANLLSQKQVVAMNNSRTPVALAANLK